MHSSGSGAAPALETALSESGPAAEAVAEHVEGAPLIELVARRFGCAKSAVSIKTGAGSKLKRVTVPD